MVRTHQPGQAVFRSVLPDDMDWRPFPAFPPSVRLAVVVGQPSEPGPYVIRVKVPSGVKMMPHRHPEEDRKSTRLNSSHLVISYAVFCLKKKKKYTQTDACNVRHGHDH